MKETIGESMIVNIHRGAGFTSVPEAWTPFASRRPRTPLSYHPRWPLVLRDGLGHEPICLEAVRGSTLLGLLPLSFVSGPLFGRFLVGLPYLNYGGAQSDDPNAAALLIERAAGLADELKVKHLELRHERPIEAPGVALTTRSAAKVHMRLDLPRTSDALWKDLKASVRNQVRKGQKGAFTIVRGGHELLPDFYSVFSRNMRDLGTPVFGRSLFQAILDHFPDQAEFCVARDGPKAVAAALLLHGWDVTEVPSASSLRSYNPSNVNMLMYWELLARAIERGSAVFDFGRSTPDGPTFRFKRQWGALPHPGEWQYLVRHGQAGDMRPDNPKYEHAIRIWKKLPVALTRLLGPPIVRGLP